MLCRKKHCALEGNGSVPVYLNVYDITPINGYAYWIGLGAYHSGVQVHGVEYAFGAHEYPTTGIFEGEPKQSEGFTFRKGILIGWTELTSAEVRKVMEELAEEYKGNAYNLITKNCNHFCNVACIRLTKKPIPSWVNRLARIGLLCNCVIPTSICTAKIGHHSINKTDEKVTEEEEKKLCKNRSKRSTPSSNSSFSSSSSTCESANRRRRSVTPTSPLMMASPSSSTATA
ncbi:hypothetical protein V2J09_005378 [Rumex salicifolius]